MNFSILRNCIKTAKNPRYSFGVQRAEGSDVLKQTRLDIERGDVIEIMYRYVGERQTASGPASRWIRAEVLACETDAWPLARLVDGQMTEVRPFMTWRLVIRRRAVPLAA